MAEVKSVAVIMAGGSGTRFWPASTEKLPKQFLTLTSARSLIQETWDRIAPCVNEKNIYVCSTRSQQSLVREHLPKASLILEPVGRNTAACIALSVSHLLKKNVSPDTVMFVLPADHHISDSDAFHAHLKDAMDSASRSNVLVTLGIPPTHAHTGYGYIEAERTASSGSVHQVIRFIEKPDARTAEECVKKDNFFWNGGIFIWKLSSIVNAFEEWMPDLWKTISSSSDLDHAYASLPSIPIDKGILEKARNVAVVPAHMGWSDVGSWSALYDLLKKASRQNIVQGGQLESIDSQGCLVRVPSSQKVALIGVEDLMVIEENGRLLITHRSKDQLVREASGRLESKNK